MGHRPPLLRLLAALLLAIGLMGSLATPSFAQDEGTPTAEEPIVDEGAPAELEEPPADEPATDEPSESEDVTVAEDPVGTLVLLYYLCDGGEGFAFTVGDPGLGNPNPLVDDCTPSSDAGGTDRTFYIYPFGDTTAVPIEVTTVDGVIMNDAIPVTNGTPHKITDKPIEEPVVQETEVDEAAEEEPPVEADFEIVEGEITGVNASQFQTGTIEIRKFRCAGNPDDSTFNILNPGEEFDLTPYENCVADDRSFTITPFGDEETFEPVAVTTEDGIATLDGIPTTSLESGAHLILEDETEIIGLFDVEANQTTVITAVNYEESAGILVLGKYTCEGDLDTEWYVNELPSNQEEIEANCVPADESFSIYPFGDREVDPIPTNTGETGSVVVEDLPITTDASPHLIVEDSTGSEQEFDIDGETPTTILVINYVPPVTDDTGTLELEKLECSGIESVDVIAGNPGDSLPAIPANCSSAAARFIIYPFGDQGGTPTQIDVDGFQDVELPVTDGTPHLVIEVDSAGVVVASEYVEIEADNFTPLQSRNPTYGSFTIYSFLCKGTANSTFDVYDPGQSVTLPSDCDFLDRSFTVTLFGGTGTSNTITTGADGIAGVNNVPTTYNTPHVITKSSGVSADFYVDKGKDTVIVAVTWQETGGTIDDDTNDSESVSQVANTGVGPMAPATNASALLLGLLSLGMLAGAALVTRRRHA